MNLKEYGLLARRSDLMHSISLYVYLGRNQARDPDFRNDWPRTPMQERQLCGQIGLEILRLLIDNPAAGARHMNIGVYERLAADPLFVEQLASASYLAANWTLDPRFTSDWATVSDEVKHRYAEFGLSVVYTLVDDYTTPGCSCPYCRNPPKRGASRRKLIMCDQRWDALPWQDRLQISESMAD